MSKPAAEEEIFEPFDEIVSPGGGRSVEAFVKHLLSNASAREVQSFFFYVSLQLAAAKKRIPSPRTTSRRKGGPR